MSKSQIAAEIVDEVVKNILAWVQETPKRQRRLRSATFWGYFGLRRRSREYIELIKATLRQHSLLVNIEDAEFGTEDKNEWVILTLVEPPALPAMVPPEAPVQAVPTPPDKWFDIIAQRQFESEKEVEFYFVMPILEQLGYTEDDVAMGHGVPAHEGARKVTRHIDIALFDGPSRSRDNGLMLVETKKQDVSEDTAGQARAYALWLPIVYYWVTDGEQIQVYLFQNAIQLDVRLMSFHRSAFHEHWAEFYSTLNRAAVVERKEQLRSPSTP
jgi:hypothetical protein